MKKVLLLLVLVSALAGGLLFLSALAALVTSHSDSAVHGPRVLVWHLAGPLAEQAPDDSWFQAEDAPLTMSEIYTALRRARRDSDVEGLALYLDDPTFGLAKAEEVRRQIAALSKAGKPVLCYLESAGEGTNGTLVYFLATACDEIHLAPAGELNLLGLYHEGFFVGPALAKLRIEPQFNWVGEYKSAVEIYNRDHYSAAAREAVDAILDRDYAVIVAAIAERRQLSEDEVRRLVDEAPYTGERALELKLIDHLDFPDEFADRIAALGGKRMPSEDLRHYRASLVEDEKKIAVVFASGTIVRGAGGALPWSSETFIGSDDLAATLRRLADDESIASVVLRVDSPGGSALASDLILREVERLAAKKPLVASLSDVAASGGYYIVAKAPTIVAEASTITGSIGVFTGKLVTGRLQSEVLGITHEPLKRGANADLYENLEPYTPAQARKVQEQVESTYRRFVAHVAAGRKLDPAAVDAVARGRVWAGSDALEKGLVDHLGGLDLAIELAARAAKVDPDVDLELLPPPPDLFDWLFSRRRSELSLDVQQVLRLLVPRRSDLLELPADRTGLERPF